ncbi:MAG: serine kinase [Novosphingobium sp. 16-62-11]|nr:MAG: serine kinase [Novosphingobium sp. 16-62-11]
MSRALQYGCVAIGGRGVLIEGPPGAGKSSLALALIDRGAMLVGDDGVMLDVHEGRLIAAPHQQIAGKLEVRNVGLIDCAVSPPVPVALVLRLDDKAPRFVEDS